MEENNFEIRTLTLLSVTFKTSLQSLALEISFLRNICLCGTCELPKTNNRNLHSCSESGNTLHHKIAGSLSCSDRIANNDLRKLYEVINEFTDSNISNNDDNLDLTVNKVLF